MTAQHTPGPHEAHTNVGKRLRSYSQSAIVAGTGEHRLKIIAGFFNDIGGDDVAAANARLFAAAEDLLNACQAVAKCGNAGAKLSREASVMVRAAIKKATQT